MKMWKNMGAALLAAVAMLVAAGVQPAFADDVRIQVVAKTINVASLVDAAGETDTVTAPGVVLGDACIAASASVDVAAMTVTCYVSAADTVTIRVQNESAGTVDLASATWRVFIVSKGTH